MSLSPYASTNGINGGNGIGISENGFTVKNGNSSVTTTNSSSTVSLDRFVSPTHSRQASSSSSSITSDFLLPPPPPAPPLPLLSNIDVTSIKNTKNLVNNNDNNNSMKVLQKPPNQNENDMNTNNRYVVQTQSGQTPSASVVNNNNNIYNKFLKEYSNKLLTTQINTTHKNGYHINNGSVTPYTPAIVAGNNQFNHCQVDSATSLVIQQQPPPETPQPQQVEPTSVESVTSLVNTNINESNISMAAVATDDQSAYGQTSGDQFEYVTLTGNVIRSVIPPGKGVSVNYKVCQQMFMCCTLYARI